MNGSLLRPARSLTLRIIAACCLIGAFGLDTHAFAAPFDHSHARWKTVLAKHVTGPDHDTRVSYAELKRSPGELERYLAELSAVTQKEYAAWSADLQMAFLINAYNAFTLKLVIDHYPLKSIRRIGSLIKSTWKKEFYTLLGAKRHLDWIEHDMLRRRFKEPRIHFALNCASISCPALRKEPYVGEHLPRQLEAATVAFLSDTSRNRFDAARNTLWISKIFDWYGRDFETPPTTIAAFVAQRMGKTDEERARILKTKMVEFNEYDWNLNDSSAK